VNALACASLLIALLLSASSPQPVELQLTMSTSKYRFGLGEEIVVRFIVSKPCQLNFTITMGKSERFYGPIEADRGLNERSLGSFDVAGWGEVKARAWVGQDAREAVAYFIVTSYAEEELYSIPAGAKAYNGSTFYQTLVVRSLDLNLTGGQTIQLYPEETIRNRISFRVWNLAVNETKRWQVYIIYSWVSSWPPPEASYATLYDNAPGERVYYQPEDRYIFIPAETVTTEFEIKAPAVPGEYYVWFCFNNRDSAADGVRDFITPLPLPAHARILVLPKAATSISLEASANTANPGTELTVEGRIEPHVTGEVTVLISHDRESYEPLALVTPAADGSFIYVFTPTSPGTYRLKASWDGDTAHLPCESEPIEIVVTTELPLSIIGLAILAAGSASSLLFLAFRRRRRFPSPEDVERHIKVAKEYVQARVDTERNQSAVRQFISRLRRRLEAFFLSFRRRSLKKSRRSS